MKIGAIVQVRTSSTRLPQKVLKELPYASGITALQQTIRRLKRSENISEITIATSQDPSDDAIIRIAEKENVRSYRGNLDDVLGRYYFAAKENHLDFIVRITGDCPCIDPDIVDLVIKKHKEGYKERHVQYTSNVIKRTYLDGLDVEVFDFNVLEEVHQKASLQAEREHVTLYIHTHPEIFKIAHVEAPKEFYDPERRITLDTEQDYVLLCAIYDILYPSKQFFGVCDMTKLFKEKPWLGMINATV